MLTDLLGIRIWWPRWASTEHRETGIVRAVDCTADGWSLLVERDNGEFVGVRAGGATTSRTKDEPC